MTRKLTKSTIPLTTTVLRDEFISASEKAFDCAFDGTSAFYPWEIPKLRDHFKLGLIVGSSGSGKSTMLRHFGEEENPIWLQNTSIISHFENPDEAINKMGAVGLNSIPSWYKPYEVLSTGEKFRADLSRKIKTGAVIDEFTSVVGRDVAKAASASLSRYVQNNDIHNVILATCHRDIIEWLQPDWVIDTDSGEYTDFFLSGQKYVFKYTRFHELYGPCLKTITI